MKGILMLALFLFSLNAGAQSTSETIKKANVLIADKKYESAFKLLDTFDPDNNDPEVVLLKQDIVQNYFVTSMMHQLFALADIRKDEDIMDYRGRNGNFTMFSFPADSLLSRLIKLHPGNCKLYKGLGDYYHDVQLKYGGDWLKSDAELFDLMRFNFRKAIEGKCGDHKSHFVLGYADLAQEKPKESIPHFVKAVELKKDYATGHYNLAYAYLFTDDRENALKHANIAFDLYTDKSYKSDAARMAGQVYTELKDDRKALDYYEKAYNLDPENYYNVRSLLGAYVRTNNVAAKDFTKKLFDFAPDNPTVYKDLEEIYLTQNRIEDLTTFFKSQLALYSDKSLVLAGLNLSLGRFHLSTDKKAAKAYFLTARDEFAKVFENDHGVFETIKEGIRKCEE